MCRIRSPRVSISNAAYDVASILDAVVMLASSGLQLLKGASLQYDARQA